MKGKGKDKAKDKLAQQPDSGQPEQVDVLQAQIAELTTSLQRERADAMNIRRRHDQQLASLKSSVTANVVEQLLPIIDNFDRSLKHIPAELKDNDYIKGVNSIVKQFEKILGDMGVAKIQTVGQPFDPNLHEAVSVEDGESDGDEEVVSEELQSGYLLGDQVIRHAMVKVTRG